MDIRKVMIYGNKKNSFPSEQEAVGIQGHDFNENASESNEGAGGTARQNIVKWTAQADNETPQVESSGFYGG